MHSKLKFQPFTAQLSTVTISASVVHIVFAVCFLIILMLATEQARAQDTACSGENLLIDMERNDPQALADIRKVAEATPNGNSLLWRIEKDGTVPSWLYGTMHVSDPRVVAMNAQARSSFDAADTIVVESAEIANLEKAQAALMADPDLTMLTDGSTIKTLLDPDDYQRVEAALQQRGVPIELVLRMKPWMIFSIIATPNCELERRNSGLVFLDKQLADEALSSGKSLKGLETLAEQISILTGLPDEMQVQLLSETAALGDTLDDVMTTMTELYLAGQIGMIMPLIQEATGGTSDADLDAYAQFEQDVILNRNHTMAERLQPILSDGNVFVAVGALHLPGKEGLVQLLQEMGYTLTAPQ